MHTKIGGILTVVVEWLKRDNNWIFILAVVVIVVVGVAVRLR
jgi:hypothetical protein